MGEESATNQFKFASEMERIFTSAEFARSPVMRRLLRFLVEETLAGRGDQLKAYSVAVDGLGRDPDFDAQTDSYPRVQVGRLRRMLDVYYNRSGTVNGERLVIPNGAYRVFLHPIYRKQERPPAPALLDSYVRGDAMPLPTLETQAPAFPDLPAADRHSRRHWARYAGFSAMAVLVALAAVISVLLIRGMSEGQIGTAAPAVEAPTLMLLPVETNSASPRALAPSIDQVLGDALHRSWVASVRSPAESGDTRTTYRLQGVLTGPRGEDLYLTLWNNQNGQRVWTGHKRVSEQGGELSAQLQAHISNIVGSSGAIATDQRKLLGAEAGPGYPCLLKAAEIRLRIARSDLPQVRKCLAQMLVSAPDSPAVLAVAADINFRLALLEPHRAARLKALAQKQAKRALMLDPYSPEAQMMSASAAVVGGNCPSAREQGLRVIELNPYEPEYQARVGILLFQCGYPGHDQYLKTARQLYPALPAFYSLPIIAAMLDRGETDEALRFALSQPPPLSMDSPFYPLTMAVAYAGAGQKGQAKTYWNQAMKAAGPNVRTPNGLLKSMLVSPELTEATGRILLKTGVVDQLQ